MTTRKAGAVWEGSSKDGKGRLKLGSGVFEGPYSYGSRFADAPGTNPEELIAAALAGCYAMALASGLTKAGHTPLRVETEAQVFMETIDGNHRITRIHLDCSANVPGISAKEFQELAEKTKTGCPISVALSAVPISLEARYV